jgi:ATP phosphoribosyltransferase
MRPLRFALAQGVLLKDALAALRAIDLDVSALERDGRQLVVRSGDIEYVLARPSDIATYVERGAADLGIVGKDVLMESGARLLELVDLKFGACRFVVAAPKDAVERSLDEYRHLGSLEVAIVKVAGSAEVAPQVGLSDWIVDLVATGATLAANGLAIVEEISASTARLVANPSAYHLRRREIAPLVERLARWASECR